MNAFKYSRSDADDSLESDSEIAMLRGLYGRTVMDVFNIVAIGPSGSGKTVYLAALHHAVVGKSLARGVSFSVTMKDNAWLLSLYDKVADTTHEFPRANPAGVKMREVVFRVSVIRQSPRTMFRRESKLIRFPIFDITYVDYAGEWLTQAHLTNDEVYAPFAERVNEAHALICMIDGSKLVDFMNDPNSSEGYLKNEFRPTVDLASSFSKPVHFVITKWDLLAGRHTLAEVNEKLIASSYSGFRHLIENRTETGRGGHPRGTVRLIPVSSVGDFVTEDEAGVVKKITGRQPVQLNVEIPIIAAVADICRLALAQIRSDIKSLANGTEVRGAGHQLLEGSRQMAGGLPDDVRVGLTGVSVSLRQVASFAITAGVEITSKLSSPARRLGRMLRRQYRRVRARGLDGVTNNETALFYVSRVFKSRLDLFEAEVANTGSILWVATEEGS